MGADQHHDWAASATSVLDWWREAGVDTLVEDEPRDWLAITRPPLAAAAPPPVDVAAPPPELPATLADFAAWRTGPDAPEAGWGQPLLAAEGDPAAALMVVVDVPQGDAVLDGVAGALFDRMLAAIGRDRSTIYLAALAVARPLGGRIAPEVEEVLASLIRHHVAIAAPRRLLLLGSAPSRALIGTDGATSPKSLHAINLNDVTIDTVASLHPRFLLERPTMKAQAWRDWQLLTGGLC